MIGHVSIFAAAAMLTGNAAQAAPADGGDTYAVRIQTGDPDLANPAGQATLQGRIGRAADLACGRSPVVPLSRAFGVESCRAALIRAVNVRVAWAVRSAVDANFAGTR